MPRARSNFGVIASIIVLVLSVMMARFVPIVGTAMLANENVIQILGVILAGQLAVLALSVPAVSEIRERIDGLGYPERLHGMADHVLSELRSNTLWSFLMFGVTFVLSVIAEAWPGSILASLPMGFDSGMLFAGAKFAFVVLSCLAMWDSVEPLFKLGKALASMRVFSTNAGQRELATAQAEVESERREKSK